MVKLLQPARNIVALGIGALGTLCILYKNFVIGRPPGWSSPAVTYQSIEYIGGAIVISAALMILLKYKSLEASAAVSVLIFFLSVLHHFLNGFVDWLNGYKALALFGGMLVLSATYLDFRSMWKKFLLISGCVLIGVFFIAAGYAHIKFADFVIQMFPAFIPFPVFWTYFCSLCLFAGGVGLSIPQVRKWAAILSGIMLSGWFILFHIPRFLVNTADKGDQLGVLESFTLAGMLYLIAVMSSPEKLENKEGQ